VRRIALAVAAALALSCAGSAGATGAARSRATVSGGTFTGLGFDACTAPSLAALGAWLGSPYRAVGIYVGGVNRACADGNLSSAWVQASTSGGWALIPLYVGKQAPCVGPKDLVRIDPAAPATQGKAAADDAVRRAHLFGLDPGTPLYFDMEGYATNDTACTSVVQQFVAAWVAELHLLGYVAGVYGSAASTIRDMLPLVASGSAPNQVDIANWNKQASIFGDPYVPDTYWPNHQRIHQYRGGHDETFAGVTLNIDNDSLDGAVATAAPSSVAGGSTPAGSAVSSDRQVRATWPAGTLPPGAAVTLTSSSLATTVNGFAAGSYTVQLRTSVPALPRAVKLQFLGPAPAGVVPAASLDGQTWTPLLRLPTSQLPPKATTGYTVDVAGHITVLTRAVEWFGLLEDIQPPSRPPAPFADLTGAPLRLYWSPSSDNSGSIVGYRILRGGSPVRKVPGTRINAAVSLDTSGRSVFRVAAVDAAGNVSTASNAIVVVRRQRPFGAPTAIPAWAWRLLDWQKARSGPRPSTPHPVPAWYWRWASWVLQPYRITRTG
jgi:Rv2525c-like, glycoside hydrolase-like domain